MWKAIEINYTLGTSILKINIKAKREEVFQFLSSSTPEALIKEKKKFPYKKNDYVIHREVVKN